MTKPDKTTAILVCVFIFIFHLFLFNSKCNAQEENEKIGYILDAIRQAQRPANNMRLKWKYETPDPVSVTLMVPGQEPPPSHIYTDRDYTVTIAGARSRIDTLITTSENKDQEPYLIHQTSEVFDGAKQRKLVNRLKGKKTTPLGWQSVRDKNSSLLNNILDGLPPALLARDSTHSRSIRDGSEDGQYLLEITRDDGVRYVLTVDANKGYNIVKYEVFVKNNRKDYEVNYTLKEYGNGVWYQAGREKIRYALRTQKPSVEERITFTSVEFDIDVPDETFHLDYPQGTKVWDSIIQDWFVVGTQKDLLIDDVLSESNWKHPAKSEGATENIASSEDEVAKDTNSSTKSPTSSEIASTNTGIVWALCLSGLLLSIIIVLLIVRKYRQ